MNLGKLGDDPDNLQQRGGKSELAVEGLLKR